MSSRRSRSREEKDKTKLPSLLLETPIRSGQSIVFAEGDVTVLGSVGSGAEIVAGGSIHIYGTLRGRAMAGINGNSAARIFCQKIEGRAARHRRLLPDRGANRRHACATGPPRRGSRAKCCASLH